jgi:Co/Zn/Cd efflux system component
MESHVPRASTDGAALRRAVRLVVILNLCYFGVEFSVALTIGSVSLFADSIDFLEDAAVRSAHRRSLVGMALAVILLVPGIATLWTAWEKFSVLVPPDPLLLSLAGFGALVVNLFCAWLLVRFHAHSGSLTRAAFLSARNDALANIAIIAAGLITAAAVSPWPDLVVGLGIFVMNLDAAREVYIAARREHVVASAQP